ncbi:hypothetical protein JQ604_29220 [Bradyrhizobium jicamae]|uniref:hypothetical protein n=1 Tax=Bradyrhizobium jicamae TaxID=280332 RepID=UPI001BA5B46D|nr:hypothetical protein [Bradyrhizobium jicamae]MBR0756277.1 hypothetical protein [Bradyrhizobium jicamae]
MRTATAYFAGVGTVVVAIAAGLGGGLTIANITSPHDGKQEVSKVERRNAPEPTQVSNAASEPVTYLAATQAAATKPVTVAPVPQQNAAPAQVANVAPAADANAQRDSNNATTNNTAAPQPAQANAAPPASNAQNASREQNAPSEDANARVRDAKRAAAEKRRAERRQEWAERRRQPRHGDEDLRDVELRVRQATDTPRLLAADPERMESPRIRLFDDD